MTPISISTDQLGRPIRVGTAPNALAVTPDGRWLYVANSGNGTVTPVSTATGAPGTPFTVGGHPRALVLAPDGQTLYVSRGDGTVLPVSTATGAPGTPIQVGLSAGALAVTPNGKILYAASYGSGGVAVRPLASTSGSAAGFQVLSMTFVDDRHGWALGTVSCPSGRCLKLLGTTNGFTWSTHPPGVPPLSPPPAVAASFGVCPDRRPCVQQIRFATPTDGYAYDPSLYVTTNGGMIWLPGGADVSSLEADKEIVFRVASTTPGCSHMPYHVASQTAGDASWLLQQPQPFSTICPPVLYKQDARVILVAYGNPAGNTPAIAQIDRSADNGANWATGPDSCGATNAYASAAAQAKPDVLVLLCQHQAPGPSGGYGSAWIIVSTDNGASFKPARTVPPLPGQPNGTQARYQLAAAAAGQILVAETGTHGSRLLFTENGGRTWRTTLTLPDRGTVILVGYEDRKYGRIAQGNSVWTTTTGGRRWEPNQFGPG